ncbi:MULTISPECIES: glycine-rich domain-containing protein [Cupriavidus]
MTYLQSRDTTRDVPSIAVDFKNALSDTEAKDYIANIDFSMLIHKLSVPDANIARVWHPEMASIAVDYYRNFLWLLRKYGENEVLAPSTEIDEIWHHHILDTYKYHEDCRAIFGTYLHHYPYFGMRGATDSVALEDAFARTQRRYHEEFGEYIMSFEDELVEVAVAGDQ